jgi:myo-inositol-1(or 4)-monophosphatase
VALEDPEGGVCGVVYDPMRDVCWAGSRGGAALLNGAEIAASGRTELSELMVATGFGYDPDVRAVQASVVSRVLPRVRDIRRAGAAALDLAWTAGGRVDAYYERGVTRWDVAAGAVLCRCVGLSVVPLSPMPPSADGVLVAPAAAVDELLALVR